MDTRFQKYKGHVDFGSLNQSYIYLDNVKLNKV